MNMKQSLKAASENIERLEKEIDRLGDFNRRCSADIKALNMCIDSVIAGEKTYCDWCEEREECQRECKGTGCTEWWIAMNPLDHPELSGYFQERSESPDESAGILSASPDC